MKGTLRVHDGKPITERSGVEVGKGSFETLPVNHMPFIFMWDEGVAKHETSPSPGIVTFPAKIAKEGDSYMFEDEQGRLFDLKIEE